MADRKKYNRTKVTRISKRSIVRRIPESLDKLLLDLQQKNNVEFIEAGNIASQLLLDVKTKKNIIKNMRRRIEF